jgi:hypothetical protein
MLNLNKIGLGFALILTHFGFSQIENFELNLEVKNQYFPAVHSFIWAQKGNKFLIIGGRKDGIHPRQPFASFPVSKNNDSIYVVDFELNEYWSAKLEGVSNTIYNQLISSNMNYHQIDDTLYTIGGYGYSTVVSDHITHPYLTTLSVGNIMDSIIQGKSYSSQIKQIKHDNFAVTGGHLGHIDGKFFLVGGHRFDGRYNPMGHSTYTQSYTNAVRIFNIANHTAKPTAYNFDSIIDSDHLRRRDYNLVPQIINDSFTYLISSGVFQQTSDLPFLYPVEIRNNSINPILNFNQYLSNYHSACASFYSKKYNSNNHLFFGGISQYQMVNDVLIKDDLVPFVKTISLLTRKQDGTYEESKLKIDMPDYLGASAEFLPNNNLKNFHEEIFDIDDFKDDSILLGWIFGGIKSSSPNPFNDNNTETTHSHSFPIEVYLIKNQTGAIKISKIKPIKILPNPVNEDTFEIEFPVQISDKLQLKIHSVSGQLLLELNNIQCYNSKSTIHIPNSITNQWLIINILDGEGQKYSTKVMLNR